MRLRFAEFFLTTCLTLFFNSVVVAQNNDENKTLWTVDWSPNGKYIALGGVETDLRVFDGHTFELINSYPFHDVYLSRLEWHPTENLLAVITQSDTKKASILDYDTQNWIELDGVNGTVRAIGWNHSGEYLAISEFDGIVAIFKKNGDFVTRFKADYKEVLGLDWHPSENVLVKVGSIIGIHDLSGKQLNHFPARDEAVVLLSVEWHPSGDFFATGDYGDAQKAENKLVQFWIKNGIKIWESKSYRGEFRNIRWSHDGKKLAGASDALRIWSKKGKLIAESESSEDYLWGVDWSPDGKFIITTSGQGKITLWDCRAKFIREIK